MSKLNKKPTLRLLLGDQLNGNHSWFSDPAAPYEYVLMEVRAEATYVTHHIQKIVGFFTAMRIFAEELSQRGYAVKYLTISDPQNVHSLEGNIRALLASGQYAGFEYQEPDEYRVAQALSELCHTLEIPWQRVSSEHFLTNAAFFSEVMAGRKRYLMESFYRAVRVKYGFLMDNDGAPLGGRWNFDAENRKRLPDTHTPPRAHIFSRDVTAVVREIEVHKIPSIGTLNPTSFEWPVSRAEALSVLEYFCHHLLPHFGTFQDAMHTEHQYLYHSRLSFSLNVKHISPREVIDAAIAAHHARPNEISLAQIEGFVRQIAGWREFMRGVYWAEMPRYRTLNALNAQRRLPHYFWNGDTKMNCVRHAVDQSLSSGYAHHIQRLMITGNFLALTGVNPDEVDAWYLGIYVDALEWVQLPNTRGMSQFADGGIVGTKPYVSSAQYINKMSNYCRGCFYRFKERSGARACPFNSLYWDFLIRNREVLEKNPRIGMGYQLLQKMSKGDIAEITEQAQRVLADLERL